MSSTLKPNDCPLVPIAREVIKYARAGTMKQAAEVMKLPATHYTDPVRFEEEINRLIKRVPIILGPSCEVARPNDFKTLSVAGMSLIVTRTKDGKANAFLNACTHRGARLTQQENGQRQRFTCPYHGWSFSCSGELLEVNAQDDFGEINK